MKTVDRTDRVNLFIGTAGDHGQLYPGAEMPFGFVKLAADTFPGAVRGSAHSGYDYNDGVVEVWDISPDRSRIFTTDVVEGATVSIELVRG